MTRRVRFLSLVALSLVCASAAGCKKAGPKLKTVPFSDDFDRAQIGPDWTWKGGHWTIDDGAAYTTGANNQPCFLNVKLPDDVVVEVDITSETPTVDSKIELMTDGLTHQSGYIFILGGWSNKLSVIARLDEHGDDRKVKGPTGVRGKQTYRWRIEKKGGDIKWFLDGELYMTYTDPAPLHGGGHDRLALSNWQNRIRYDNLKIWAHADAPPVKTSTVGR